MRHWLVLLVVCLAPLAHAGDGPAELPIAPAALASPSTLAPAMPELARATIARYADADRGRYLNNLFRLQLVAGDYTGALASLHELRGQMAAADPSNGPTAFMQYELYAQAKLAQAGGAANFGVALAQAFQAHLSPRDDVAALRIASLFAFDLARGRAELQEALDRHKGKATLSVADSVALVRQFQPYAAYAELADPAAPLLAQDSARRFIVDDAVMIRTVDGATLSAVVARRRDVDTPQPAALYFTIYANLAVSRAEAMRTAAHGYVGVAVDTRGKRLSPDAVAPYEHEVADTYGAIDWISKQPWSDGQVGMYGGSYSGFAAWAATKRLHPALKTIVPYVAAIPGLGVPMENNIFLNANYGWAFFVTNNKYLDNEVYNQRQRWSDLNERWFASGRPYRQIDQVDGTPNSWLQRWLRHPAYDAYWQAMVPYRSDFARIKIPVLSITGYYDDGQISAIEYLKQHYQYNPQAEHYLVIGPYDHFGAQRSQKTAVLNDYAIDPAAQFDTPELTYQWLDYVMRHGAKPAMLADHINYEVMGANRWQHAPTLAAMSTEKLTLYLTTAPSGRDHVLDPRKPRASGYLVQTVDLNDRKSVANDYYPAPIVGKERDPALGLAFVSAPFDAPVQVNGSFAGLLRASLNQRDVDIGATLYEVMPDGRLFHLSYFLGRASYAADMARRQLLAPGKIAAIAFSRTRVVSRQMSKGSRLLLVLDVNKNSFAQVNYGTGKDVSDESRADAHGPLTIRWYNDSHITVPISR